MTQLLELRNATVAAVLERLGDLLSAHGADSFRARAYREGARVVRDLDGSIVEVARRGRKALETLPHIGAGLASAIDELLHTGGLRRLERLEGQTAPEDLFAAIPGVGEELAHRIHEDLHIDTLEELELAAHDGRLEMVEGFGPGRIEAARDYLASTLARSTPSRARARVLSGNDHGPSFSFDHEAHPLPPVDLLLDIDRRYRELSEAGELDRIAPTRFNPDHHKWLPVWHPEEAGLRFTVLHSNSALAHKLGQTRDWVVIYFEDNGEEEQATIVTEYRGPLRGRRVVRGREDECRTHYASERVQDEVKEWAHQEASRRTIT